MGHMWTQVVCRHCDSMLLPSGTLVLDSNVDSKKELSFSNISNTKYDTHFHPMKDNGYLVPISNNLQAVE